MNRKLEYVITYQLHVYRQIMITFGWYLLVKAVQETCKANFYVKNVVPVYTQGDQNSTIIIASRNYLISNRYVLFSYFLKY